MGVPEKVEDYWRLECVNDPGVLIVEYAHPAPEWIYGSPSVAVIKRRIVPAYWIAGISFNEGDKTAVRIIRNKKHYCRLYEIKGGEIQLVLEANGEETTNECPVCNLLPVISEKTQKHLPVYLQDI